MIRSRFIGFLKKSSSSTNASGQEENLDGFESEDGEEKRGFNTFVDLVDENEPVPWNKVLHYPLALITLYWEDRWRHLAEANPKGEDLKMGILSEMNTHILIDALFITITAVPIFSATLPMGYSVPGTDEDYRSPLLVLSSQYIMAALTYTTFVLQMVAILCHAMLCFACVEVNNNVFPKWLKTKTSAFVAAAQIHICGFYCFIAMFLLWPLTQYRWPYNIICVMSCGVPFVLIVVLHGHQSALSFIGPWSCINPAFKLTFSPWSKELREQAKIEANIILPHHQHDIPLCPDLSDILDELDMAHYKSSFRRERINYASLPLLSDMDFHSLKVAIGDKMRIRAAAAAGLGVSTNRPPSSSQGAKAPGLHTHAERFSAERDRLRDSEARTLTVVPAKPSLLSPGTFFCAVPGVQT